MNNESKTPDELLRVNPAEARVYLDKLPLPDKIEAIMKVSGKQRQELILLANDSDEIVTGFPKEELFLTIKEIGAMDALPLIELSTSEQLNFMMDIDCWEKDHIKPDKVIEWLTILFACGEDKVASWLDYVDLDFLALIFKNFTSVFKVDNEREEGAQDTAAFSLDDLYFVKFNEPSVQNLLIRIIEIIREFHPNLYFTLMESIIWDVKSEIEENAYRWRSARLADQGVPTFHEAIEIYRPPLFQSKVEKKQAAMPESLPFDSDAAVPAYSPEAERSSMLTRAMLSISKETLDRVKNDWAYVCNSVVMADIDNFDDLKKVKQSLIKAANYVNIGLEYLSSKDHLEAGKILEKTPLDEVFRTGYAQAVTLRKKSSSIISKGFLKADLSPADEPWRAIIKGTLLKHPQYYAASSGGQTGIEYRDFASCQEIDKTMGQLDEVEAMGRLMQSRFPGYLEHLDSIPLERCNIRISTDLTWSILLFTAVLNHLKGRAVRFWPVSPSDLDSVYPELWSKDCPRQKELSRGVRKQTEELLFGFGNVPDELLSPAKRYLAKIYSGIEQDIGSLTGPPIDPRYVSTFLVELPISRSRTISH